MTDTVGKVYIVGAGPGDPGLITVRGLECLQHADVVIYDYLANEALLEHVPPHAERIFAGKSTDHHTLLQSEINALLIDRAKKVSRVVRLKGGDPFVFGRGGEECIALVDAGVPFEVVPGISAGIAAPAFAGIPVTHRHISAGVAFLTAHGDPDSGGAIPDPLRTVTKGTLVLFMGVKGLPRVVERLLELGRPSDTPVALVEWGTLPRQRTVTGTLNDIVEHAARERIEYSTRNWTQAGRHPRNPNYPLLFVLVWTIQLGYHKHSVQLWKGCLLCLVRAYISSRSSVF